MEARYEDLRGCSPIRTGSDISAAGLGGSGRGSSHVIGLYRRYREVRGPGGGARLRGRDGMPSGRSLGMRTHWHCCRPSGTR